MSNFMQKTMTMAVASGLIMSLVAAPQMASAQNYHKTYYKPAPRDYAQSYECQVTKKDSAKTGTVLGAVLGAAVGSQVAGKEKGLGAIVGALVGAGVGSKLGKDAGKQGCNNVQNAREDRYGSSYGYQSYQPYQPQRTSYRYDPRSNERGDYRY